jgi:tetratricopeptide (TPR) repeat protein
VTVRKFALGIAVLGVSAAVALAPAAADAISDGNAGLAALQTGKYDAAILLLTRAIEARTLTSQDLEFAYLNRGKAFLAQGNTARAVSDLGQAVSLAPDDGEAREALRQALGPQPDARNGATAATGGAAEYGCSAPMPPTVSEGRTATRQEMQAELGRVQTFISVSDQYQVCLSSAYRAKQAEAERNNQPLDPALGDGISAMIHDNQLQKEQLGAAYNAAVLNYKAANP